MGKEDGRECDSTVDLGSSRRVFEGSDDLALIYLRESATERPQAHTMFFIDHKHESPLRRILWQK
jgi:hypothetical protein